MAQLTALQLLDVGGVQAPPDQAAAAAATDLAGVDPAGGAPAAMWAGIPMAVDEDLGATAAQDSQLAGDASGVGSPSEAEAAARAAAAVAAATA